MEDKLDTWIIEHDKLPITLERGQAVVTSSRVYMLGGSNGTNTIADIYSWPINSDGTLGTCVEEFNSLPGRLKFSQVVVTSSSIYLLGGFNGFDAVADIYSCSINTDGTLGTWVIESDTLPIGIYGSQAVVTSSRVYLLGGYNTNYTSAIYSCPINADGTLGAWITESNTLPGVLDSSQAIVTSSRVYLLGGSNGATISTIYSCPINTDGILGTWVTESNTLPTPLVVSQAIVVYNKVYLLGGFNGRYTSSIYSCPITASGTLGTWAIESNTLPGILSDSQAIVTSSRVYLIGGYSSGPIANIYSCKLNKNKVV